jgi:tRNA 2-thiouridine synthesizing protein C
MNPRKHILLVCRKAPYGNSLSREALDIALASSVFDQKLSLAFIGDGVWQLLKDQNSTKLSVKNHGKLSSVFPLYDINSIYIDEVAMTERNIDRANLVVNAIPYSHAALAELMHQADIIFNF